MHSRSLKTIHPRMLTMSVGARRVFHRPGRHRVHQARSGGWGYSFFGCLSHSTIDHASLS